jgi:hypothetical protein
MNAMTMADVLVGPIAAGDIRPLYPLMQAAEPDLKLSAWLSYSRRMTKAKIGARAGIMVARRRGHTLPCGAVHYRLDRNLRYGQLLTAEHFIAIDLLYPHAVLTALFEALDGVATACGCSAMRSILHENGHDSGHDSGRDSGHDRGHDSGADLLDRLSVAGHRRDGMTLTKTF